jgi:hypothetical protein
MARYTLGYLDRDQAMIVVNEVIEQCRRDPALAPFIPRLQRWRLVVANCECDPL